jgi:glycosyltransferase involved in cell wall biosynthesis
MHLVAYTDADSFGGAERALATLLAHIESATRVTVVGTTRAIVEAVAAERPGARAKVLHPVVAPWDLLGFGRHVAALWTLRPDVLHINLRTPYACVYGLLAAMLIPHTRLVAVEHLMLEGQSRLRYRLKRWTSRRLFAHVAVSEATARLVERDAGLQAHSIVVIHNGVPAAKSAKEPERADSGNVVGSVGRLETQKGFDVLIDALARLPRVTAVVAGEGPQRHALERRAHAAGVAERFLLPGWSDDAGHLLRGFDVFVLSSRFEGLPLTLLEAMEAGLPIVATDVGGVCEAVADGETALVVPPEDPLALAAAIEALLDDRELARRLGAAAHEHWMTAFDLPIMVAAYERIYRDAA